MKQDGIPSDDKDVGCFIFRIRTGDPQAWTEHVEAEYQKWLRRAEKRLRIHQDAEDAVQDAIIRMMLNAPSFRGTKRGQLRKWSWRILDSVLADFGRKSRRPAPVCIDDYDTPAPGDGPEEDAVRAERARRIQVAVAEMPKHLAEVAQGRMEAKSFGDIAARQGVSERAVFFRWEQVMKWLRRVFGVGA